MEKVKPCNHCSTRGYVLTGYRALLTACEKCNGNGYINVICCPKCKSSNIAALNGKINNFWCRNCDYRFNINK